MAFDPFAPAPGSLLWSQIGFAIGPRRLRGSPGLCLWVAHV